MSAKVCEYCGRVLALIVDSFCQELCKEALRVYDQGEFVLCLESEQLCREITSSHLRSYKCECKNVSEYHRKYPRAYTRSKGRVDSQIKSLEKWRANLSKEQEANYLRHLKEGKNTEQALLHFSEGQKRYYQNASEKQIVRRRKSVRDFHKKESYRENTRRASQRVWDTYSAKNREERLAVSINSMKKASKQNRSHVSGYFRELVYFRSSYEYRMMKVYSILGIQWTTNHHIQILWCNPKKKKEGLNSKYPPDFLVNGNEIVETKGWDNESVQFKAEAARKFVSESNRRYKSYSILFDSDIVKWEKKVAEKLGWTYERYRKQVEKELMYYKELKKRKKARK